MIRPRTSSSEVRAAAASVAGTPIVEASPLPVSYANETWRVTTRAGTRYVVELGPLSSESKWRSAHRALELAASAGIPVAPLVGSARHADRLVRLFEWVEGRTPVSAALDDAGVRRLFGDLGAAVRALHEIGVDAFGSRLDGSAPSFRRWPEYVEYRLAAIGSRCRATRALDEHELRHVCAVIEGLAAEIGDHARPTLCHRDLHPENLLVDPTGRLVAVLDFDTAEAWDRAGGFDKLDRLLIPAFPGARRWFDEAYGDAGRPDPRHWVERVLLVALMEALNTLPNAVPAGRNADDARRRMRVLAEPKRSYPPGEVRFDSASTRIRPSSKGGGCCQCTSAGAGVSGQK